MLFIIRPLIIISGVYLSNIINSWSYGFPKIYQVTMQALCVLLLLQIFDEVHYLT